MLLNGKLCARDTEKEKKYWAKGFKEKMSSEDKSQDTKRDERQQGERKKKAEEEDENDKRKSARRLKWKGKKADEHHLHNKRIHLILLLLLFCHVASYFVLVMLTDVES